jgi:1,4-dihydroxy-2-naphthoyl-CoA hydrolase
MRRQWSRKPLLSIKRASHSLADVDVLRPELSVEGFTQFGASRLPGMFGLQPVSLGRGEFIMRMDVRPEFLAPNGFLHAASVVALADTCCGYACFAHLPEGAESFTTIELKTNFLGTAREGSIDCVGRAAHLGRNTQVWDATVSDARTNKAIALFRCTQMVLWPRN